MALCLDAIDTGLVSLWVGGLLLHHVASIGTSRGASLFHCTWNMDTVSERAAA